MKNSPEKEDSLYWQGKNLTAPAVLNVRAICPFNWQAQWTSFLTHYLFLKERPSSTKNLWKTHFRTKSKAFDPNIHLSSMNIPLDDNLLLSACN